MQDGITGPDGAGTRDGAGRAELTCARKVISLSQRGRVWGVDVRDPNRRRTYLSLLTTDISDVRSQAIRRKLVILCHWKTNEYHYSTSHCRPALAPPHSNNSVLQPRSRSSSRARNAVSLLATRHYLFWTLNFSRCVELLCAGTRFRWIWLEMNTPRLRFGSCQAHGGPHADIEIR